MWLLLTQAVLAAQPTPEAAPTNVPPRTIGQLLTDLRGDDAPDRLFAARSLKGKLRRALRVEARGRQGTLAADEARSVLVELDERLPDACTDALRWPNVVAPCAEMLAMLDVTAAAGPVRDALVTEERARVRRRVEAALQDLEGG